MIADPHPAVRLRRGLNRSAAVSLLIGLAISGALYLCRKDTPENNLVDDFRNSKVFRHDLEIYGGKMSLLGSQLHDWFTGLWQGRQLAVTIGCLFGAVSLLLFLAARLVHDEIPPGEAIREYHDQRE